MKVLIKPFGWVVLDVSIFSSICFEIDPSLPLFHFAQIARRDARMGSILNQAVGKSTETIFSSRWGIKMFDIGAFEKLNHLDSDKAEE